MPFHGERIRIVRVIHDGDPRDGKQCLPLTDRMEIRKRSLNFPAVHAKDTGCRDGGQCIVDIVNA